MVATKSERFVAFMIDYFIIMVLQIILVILMPYINFGFPNSTEENIAQAILKNYVVFSIALKDLIFKNQSLGKKILNIQVVEVTSSVTPRKWKLLLRNFILVCTLPIEILLVLIGNRRLGDIICDTKVIKNK